MEKWKWGKIKLDGFQNEFQEGYIEVTPDAGIPYRRERFTDIQDIAQCVFTLERQKYIDFMSWYKYDTKQGSIPFKIMDCRIGEERIARITGKPKWNPNLRYWNTNVTLMFDSEVFYLDRVLAANYQLPIVANGKYLTTQARLSL